MARYFRVSISSTNANGPFDVFYNTSNGGALSFAILYPSGGNATNLAKSLFIGGNTVAVQTPDNVYSIQIIQQVPYVAGTPLYPTALTPSPTTAAPTTSPTTAAPTTAAPTTAAPTTASPTTASPTTASPTTASPTTAAPTTSSPSTAAPTTAAPTTASPTTASPTTASPTPQPTTASPTTASPTTASPTTASPTTASPTTASPTTASPTTAAPTTASPTTAAPTTPNPTPQPTTAAPTTASPTTASPTTASPTTASPTTASPTTASPTTASPTTASPTPQPTTASPTTASPTTASPTTASPTTASPTTASPTTASPTTASPTTASPTPQPTTASPTTASPTTASPTTASPTTASPTTASPTTASPTTASPTTASPTTASPTTASPTTASPTTASPTTASPTTASPTTASPTTASPTTASPTTASPTTASPTTASPTTASPTTASPTTASPTTASPTTAPTTASPTTAAPTTAAPTGTPATVNIHLEEYNASPTTFLDANLTVNGVAYYFSGDFSASVPAGTSNNVTLEAAEATPSNVWGPYTTGSANLLIYENGTLIYNTINNYYSGSGTQNFSQAVTYGAGKTYVISGSTLPIDVPEVCYNCGEGFTLTTGSILYGEYPAVDICNLDDGTAIRVNYNVSTRPNRVNIYNNNGFFTSSVWAGEAAYAGPWGSYLNTSPDGNIYFTYSAAYAPYSISVEYGNADPISPVEDDISIAVFCTPPTGSFDFLKLFPTGSVIPAYATASCNANPSLNLASFYFTASGAGGPYGYSASFAQDVNGNPIWTPSGSGFIGGIYYEINPATYTWAWIQTVPTQSVYYPAISDGSNTVYLQPIYDCVPLDATFVIAPLTNTATGTIYYPALPVSGSQSRGTSYRVTGSLNTLVSVSAVATNGSTFRGWSFTSGSTAGIFETASTIQIPLTNTGSIFYAIIDKNIISGSFCYYNSDPIGTVACDACAVTSSVYFDAYALTGSNYAGINWYSDENLTTLVPTGYYKLTGVETSTPIYYVSGNPVQTRTANGYCSDVTLTC